jgi:hypothetical protein
MYHKDLVTGFDKRDRMDTGNACRETLRTTLITENDIMGMRI